MRPVASSIASLSDLLALRAVEQGANRAYTFLESGEQEVDRITWLDLDRRSRSLAAAIRDRVDPGARVLLLFPPGLEFVSALFGAFRARTIAVPAYPPSGTRSDRVAARLRGMVADAGVELVLTTTAVSAKADALSALVPELLSPEWLNVDDVELSAPPPLVEDVASADDIAFLQYTSGSTSAPRGVMVTHANLLHNLAHSARLGLHDASSISVSWLPVNHDMGLIQGVLQPAFSGFPAWLMSPVAFLQRPARWLQALSTLRATHSGGPNFAYDLCVRKVTDAQLSELDLSAWRVAYNGAEPVRADTLIAFHEKFRKAGFRWRSFYPVYGLAEATLVVSSGRRSYEPAIRAVDASAISRGRLVTATQNTPIARNLDPCGGKAGL